LREKASCEIIPATPKQAPAGNNAEDHR
jgi:hypothetical protein